jgi:hypothetical protein
MMTRVGWIRVLGLLCAGLCVAPMLAQNPPDRKNGANAGAVYRQQPPPAVQRQAPAAPAPRAAQTNIQKQPVAAQPQPAAGAVKPYTNVPTTNVPTRPITSVRPNVSPSTVPVQTSVPIQTQPAQTSTPGMYTHTVTSGQPSGSTTPTPAQSIPGQAPSLYINKPVQSVQPKVAPTQTYTPVQTLPTSPSGATGNTGTSDGSPATRGYVPPANTKGPPYTRYNPTPSDGNTKGSPTPGADSSSGTGNNLPSSDGNSNGSRTTGPKPPPAPAPTPPPTDAHKPPPPHVQPQRPHAPVQWPLPPVQIFPSPAIPSGRVFPPRGYEPPPPSRVMPPTPTSEPSPVSSPTPTSPSPAQPMDKPQQAQQPAPVPQTLATPQSNGPTPQPGVASSNTVGTRNVVVIEPQTKTDPILSSALTLTTKTNRPVVGKDVVVVAALEPSHPGASYRLNWGDGSAVETVSESGTHRYAKAKMYKVSASTVVGDSQLNHEILVQVGPVAPRIDWLLAALAGVAALLLHFPPLPKLTASCRWGAPGVPQMTLLNREPYLSLSFEPGARPAEEDITFSKKRRKSGLEQG